MCSISKFFPQFQVFFSRRSRKWFPADLENVSRRSRRFAQIVLQNGFDRQAQIDSDGYRYYAILTKIFCENLRDLRETLACAGRCAKPNYSAKIRGKPPRASAVVPNEIILH